LYKIVVAGTGFMCDAYDLFVINLVIVILKTIHANEETTTAAGSISTAALWGAVAGQVVFGFLADKIGRRKGFIITLTLVVIGAIGSAFSPDTSSLNVFVFLSIWRFILGFGIGGEYPLSATISSESSTNHHQRGTQVAAVFSMQGMGILLAPIVVILLLLIFGDQLNLIWRFAL